MSISDYFCHTWGTLRITLAGGKWWIGVWCDPLIRYFDRASVVENGCRGEGAGWPV